MTLQTWKSPAIMCAGAKHTQSEAVNRPVSTVFSRPEFMVLDVGNHHLQGRGHRFGDVLKPHVHPDDLSSLKDGFETPEGGQTMPTTTDALRAILAEVTPGVRPSSTDSWLPDHLVEAAIKALEAEDEALQTTQLAFNALSMAAWHVARNEPGKALGRIRRAQSHITSSMEGKHV